MRLSYLETTIFIFLALTLPTSSIATMVVHLPLSKMTKESDAIVEGKVEKTYCGFVDKDIFTFAVIRVSKWHKSSNNLKNEKSILVRVAGGRIGKQWLTVHGMPSFSKGEQVFLFLIKNKNFYLPIGLQQGKFSIQKDQNGSLKAIRTFSNINFLKKQISEPSSLSYDQLLFSVKKYFKEPTQ